MEPLNCPHIHSQTLCVSSRSSAMKGQLVQGVISCDGWTFLRTYLQYRQIIEVNITFAKSDDPWINYFWMLNSVCGCRTVVKASLLWAGLSGGFGAASPCCITRKEALLFSSNSAVKKARSWFPTPPRRASTSISPATPVSPHNGVQNMTGDKSRETSWLAPCIYYDLVVLATTARVSSS